jgi:hypothetical protein
MNNKLYASLVKNTSFLHFHFLLWLSLQEVSTSLVNQFRANEKNTWIQDFPDRNIRTNLCPLQSFKVYSVLPCALPQFDWPISNIFTCILLVSHSPSDNSRRRKGIRHISSHTVHLFQRCRKIGCISKTNETIPFGFTCPLVPYNLCRRDPKPTIILRNDSRKLVMVSWLKGSMLTLAMLKDGYFENAFVRTSSFTYSQDHHKTNGNHLSICINK